MTGNIYTTLSARKSKRNAKSNNRVTLHNLDAGLARVGMPYHRKKPVPEPPPYLGVLDETRNIQDPDMHIASALDTGRVLGARPSFSTANKVYHYLSARKPGPRIVYRDEVEGTRGPEARGPTVVRAMSKLTKNPENQSDTHFVMNYIRICCE
jgi:hypothetical protein